MWPGSALKSSFSRTRSLQRQLPSFPTIFSAVSRRAKGFATVNDEPISLLEPGELDPSKVHNPSTSLDSFALSSFHRLLRERRAILKPCPLPTLIHQYNSQSGKILDAYLPYESTPVTSRRVDFDSSDDGVVLVVHVIDDGTEQKISICSGFAIDPRGSVTGSVVVSCAHTLDEVVLIYFHF